MGKAIEVDNVAIRYMTGDFKSIGLKEYVIRKLTGNYHIKEFWADQGITFSVDSGDMLGIIGSNGVGKSTLLKAISGIMIPTYGTVKVNGKVAALLELTSGFDKDLSVKENTFLRGAMLGYTRQFMNEKYDEIIDFAELKEFQDHAFKQLSSGMKSRLAFSIAAMVNPDILILDEVLSVGDGAFRIKSGDKMREILSSGVTGILVSHSVSQIRELCNKVLWLDHGRQITFSDDVNTCCDAYEQFLAKKEIPKTEEDILRLAEQFNQDEQQRLNDEEREFLGKVKEYIAENKAESVDAAYRLLEEEVPDLLKDNALDKLRRYLEKNS